MLLFVGPVLRDRGDEVPVFRATLAHRHQHPVQRSVAAMLVVDVDRGEDIKVACAQPVAEGLAGQRACYRVECWSRRRTILFIYLASSASIAATSAGSSGVVAGANRPTTEPSLPSRNFSKFHNTSGSSVGVMP